jgi:hypothetical protein
LIQRCSNDFDEERTDDPTRSPLEMRAAHGMGHGHANAIVGDFRQERGLEVAPSNGRSSFIRATPSTQGVTGEGWRRTAVHFRKRRLEEERAR